MPVRKDDPRRSAVYRLYSESWAKSLGQAQPKSEAWLQHRAIRAGRKEREALAKERAAMEAEVARTAEVMALDLEEAAS